MNNTEIKYQAPAKQDRINWLAKYLATEDFPEKHVEALCVIAGLFNECEESEAEVFNFSHYLYEKYGQNPAA